MKKVLKEQVMEDAKYFCDVHPDRECFTELQTSSWYGSEFDMMQVKLHLCDECLTELYAHLKAKYGVEPKDIDL